MRISELSDPFYGFGPFSEAVLLQSTSRPSDGSKLADQSTGVFLFTKNDSDKYGHGSLLFISFTMFRELRSFLTNRGPLFSFMP